MKPKKGFLTAGRTFWYVPTDFSYYLHDDGVIRHGCQAPDSRMSGHFKTREAARQAIRLHKRLKAERTAEVVANYNGAISFKIVGPDGFKLSGSEPYHDRPFSSCLIAVGMVLKSYGVKDFKFHWSKYPA